MTLRLSRTTSSHSQQEKSLEFSTTGSQQHHTIGCIVPCRNCTQRCETIAVVEFVNPGGKKNVVRVAVKVKDVVLCRWSGCPLSAWITETDG